MQVTLGVCHGKVFDPDQATVHNDFLSKYGEITVISTFRSNCDKWAI